VEEILLSSLAEDGVQHPNTFFLQHKTSCFYHKNKCGFMASAWVSRHGNVEIKDRVFSCLVGFIDFTPK
jgi:hypothetical protein